MRAVGTASHPSRPALVFVKPDGAVAAKRRLLNGVRGGIVLKMFRVANRQLRRTVSRKNSARALPAWGCGLVVDGDLVTFLAVGWLRQEEAADQAHQIDGETDNGGRIGHTSLSAGFPDREYGPEQWGYCGE